MRFVAKILAAAVFFVFLFPAVHAYADQVHRVKPGETLESIAAENNTSVEKIMARNPFMEDPLFLVPYQIVIIPEEKPGLKHSVAPGETLDSIAAGSGVSPEVLAAYNGLEKSRVFPGQVLVIPPVSTGPAGEGAKAGPKPAESPKQAHRYNIPELRSMFPDWLFLSGAREQKAVALTFDDGPDDFYTPRILDILGQQGVRATFFLVGSRIEGYPQVVRRLVAEGHQAAGHGWTHTNFRLRTAGEVAEQLDNTASAFKSLTGLDPLFFRPPYGELSPESMNQLIDRGITTVTWNSDSQDWNSTSADRVLANTLVDTRPGSIILMHSTGAKLNVTVSALPDLIYTLKAQGYKLVTVAELLGRPAYRKETS